MRPSRYIIQTICLAAFLALPAISGATIMIGTGLIDGSGGLEEVVFNGAGTIGGPAETVRGRTNHSDTLVDFTGHEDLVTTAMGQAKIDAVDGFFDFLEIKLADPTLGFTRIQFNIESAFDGSVELDFEDQFGNIFDETFELGANGQNKFTAYSDDNQVIVNAKIHTISDEQAITDIKQVRLGPTARTNPIPEPATMLLLGSGLLGLVGAGRKKIFKK